jgi:hypothetical protein
VHHGQVRGQRRLPNRHADRDRRGALCPV